MLLSYTIVQGFLIRTAWRNPEPEDTAITFGWLSAGLCCPSSFLCHSSPPTILIFTFFMSFYYGNLCLSFPFAHRRQTIQARQRKHKPSKKHSMAPRILICRQICVSTLPFPVPLGNVSSFCDLSSLLTSVPISLLLLASLSLVSRIFLSLLQPPHPTGDLSSCILSR